MNNILFNKKDKVIYSYCISFHLKKVQLKTSHYFKIILFEIEKLRIVHVLKPIFFSKKAKKVV